MTTIASPQIGATIEAAAPVIREHANAAEEMGRLPMPVVETLRETGLFRMLTPASLGGGEVTPLEYLQATEAVARLDGSTGWCFMIGAGAASFGARMADEGAEEIFGDPKAVVAGAIFPFGRATVADGGFVVDGRWSYASGCQHATFIGGACQVFDGSEVRMSPAGFPEIRLVFAPPGEAQIIENWDVSGLRGTGSHDIALDSVFVAEHHTMPLATPFRGRHYQGPTYRFPFMGYLAPAISAAALGIAQASIDHCLDLAQAKVPAGTDSSLLDRALFQYQLAEAVAHVSSARAWLHAEAEATYALGVAGEAVPLAQRNALLLAASNATRSSAAAVDLMYSSGGGSANYMSSPLQRCLRDLRAITQHVGTSPRSWENAGRILAGFPPPNPMILL